MRTASISRRRGSSFRSTSSLIVQYRCATTLDGIAPAAGQRIKLGRRLGRTPGTRPRIPLPMRVRGVLPRGLQNRRPGVRVPPPLYRSPFLIEQLVEVRDRDRAPPTAARTGPRADVVSDSEPCAVLGLPLMQMRHEAVLDVARHEPIKAAGEDDHSYPAEGARDLGRRGHATDASRAVSSWELLDRPFFVAPDRARTAVRRGYCVSLPLQVARGDGGDRGPGHAAAGSCLR